MKMWRDPTTGHRQGRKTDSGMKPRGLNARSISSWDGRRRHGGDGARERWRKGEFRLLAHCRRVFYEGLMTSEITSCTHARVCARTHACTHEHTLHIIGYGSGIACACCVERGDAGRCCKLSVRVSERWREDRK